MPGDAHEHVRLERYAAREPVRRPQTGRDVHRLEPLQHARIDSAVGRRQAVDEAEALGRLEENGDGLSREGAVVSDNLGYCHIAMDRVEVGLPYVQRSISLLDSLGARQAMDYPCLDLCFAMLKLEKLDQGESWGIRALGLGNEFGRQDVVKNSHYLLAEIYSTMGRGDRADEHYEALANYYPDFPALKHYLHQISLTGMLNLRA